jgi:hypothetical protein
MMTWQQFKAICNSKQLRMQYHHRVETDTYLLSAYDGPMIYRCDLWPEHPDFADFDQNYKPTSNQSVESSQILQPFADKKLKNGLKLYRRKHGVYADIPAGETQDISLAVPYNLAKINEVEIVGCNIGDKASLKVLDTPAGTISTVPNYMLNQFGFDVCLPDGHFKDVSDYDADVIKDLKIVVSYTNNTAQTKKVGVNFVLHELK